MVLFFLLVAGAALAAFPMWLLVRGVKRGVWNGRGVDVVRAERPFAFWFGIVMYGVIAAIILAFPLYIAWNTVKPLVAQDACLDSGAAWHDGRCAH